MSSRWDATDDHTYSASEIQAITELRKPTERKPSIAILELEKLLAPRYKLLEQLGTGAFSTVFSAIDNQLQMKCAIKVLAPTDENRLMQYFKSEARVTMTLNHPNIVRTYTYEERSPFYVIIMELVDGQTLDSYIRSTRPFRITEKFAKTAGIQVCSALSYAHSKGVVHRDIKPSNLFVLRDGTVKVGDFGISVVLGESSRGVSFVGTPYYMSPEQFSGKPVDGRSDIYSVGITLLEALTGESVPSAWRSFRAGTSLDKHMKYVIGRCVAVDPDSRFQSASDVAKELAKESGAPEYDMAREPSTRALVLAILEIHSSNGRLLRVPLTSAQRQVLIGRHTSCDIRFADAPVSRYHALIIREGDLFTIQDLHSIGGTFLNGRIVDRPMRLSNKDELVMGRTRITFHEAGSHTLP